MREPNQSSGKRRASIPAIVALLFAVYMGAYESTGNGAGLFIGNTPHRHFMKWKIPAAADPLFVPGDWIDENARQAWHLISG
jgi:hypothetical protein